ncbi:Amidohydrolase 1 domain and Metal-dependent hydrolase, composite domain-containing protein [Strongyloides ratti]|uniref:Amidohydrolase 1 domain and Metal-dependent hydrolase, composite domain-containing protein n=1 Tax=Strongyloides ratti TaxID=34506 RepID=A0A090LNN8_STRRB|nr:Amidohydrolase 1 domain and Metal-dependent hydrolase, composite domain-containing protein [Strongyloides ratti]CEF71371.1 Amidohydrolase 1 domain and Metal-dependent hydrolase, composite domain-containing protein [Strongyloides ratti]
MFPFLPFLTFPKNDIERRRRDKYLTIQISSQTGTPIFKRKKLPISSLPHKGTLTTYESQIEIERTIDNINEKCQIKISNDNNNEIFENIHNKNDINLTTTSSSFNSSENNIMDNDIKQNTINNDGVLLSTDINDHDKFNDKNDVQLTDGTNKLFDENVLEKYPVKQSPTNDKNIINDVNESNLLSKTDLQTSFYVEKLNSINLDEITEDEIFGQVKKTPLMFNPTFKESSPVPFEEDLNKEEEDKHNLLIKDNDSKEESNDDVKIESLKTKVEDTLIIKENKNIDENVDELTLDSRGKLIHSPIPPKNVKISKTLSSSKQEITKSTSGKSSPLNKGNRKDVISPRDNNTSKSNERKYSNERISSPHLKTSSSYQRIHSVSPRPASGSQTNLSNERKISSSGRLSSPNNKNIRQSNDKIERLSHIQARPMERLTDMGRTKSTPPNVLKQQSTTNVSSPRVPTPVKQSNRNPFAVSEAMLAIFGDSSSGGAGACFNKIPPPNPALKNRNFKRSNVLEREQDQPSIFPNTKPIPGPSCSSSTFDVIPDHDKAYDEAKKRGKWMATDSAFSKVGGTYNAEITCGPEHDIENENDELNNEGILVVEETPFSGSRRFVSQKDEYNKNVVCQPGPDIYGEDDNDDENSIKIEERKTSVNEINTNECIITCKDGQDITYDHITNCPENIKINCFYNKDEDCNDHQKGNKIYKDKSCDNTSYSSRDNADLTQPNSISPSFQYTNSGIPQTNFNDVLPSQDNDEVSNIIDNINYQTTIFSDNIKNNFNRENSNDSRNSFSQNSSNSGINNDSEDESSLGKGLQSSKGNIAIDKMVKPGNTSSGSDVPLLIKNGQIINDDSSFIANILIEGSIIKQVGNQFPIPDGCEVIDGTNKIIIPAGIDIHTEFSSFTSIDDFTIGSKAAIAGGTATIIDVVIPRNESESLLSAFERTKNLINGKCQCNAALSVMILTWNNVIQKEMDCLVKEKGVNNFILNISSCTDDQLFEIMEFCKKLGIILRISPENNSVIKILERKMLNLGVTGPEGYCQSRPIQLETEKITSLGTFSQLSNCPVSIVSLTSSEGCQALQSSNINGGILTAEIPIVALAQNGDIYYDKNLALASTFIIRNPLRPGRQHANTLLNALSTLPLAMCVSDHKATKNYDRITATDFTKMIHGVPAVEERLPVLWEKAVCSGSMNYMKFVAVTSTNAAKAFNMYPRKGRIEIGADADITILDTTIKRQISVKNQMSTADFNAFEQMTVHCQVVATICGGNIVYQDNKIVSNGTKTQNDMYLPLLPNSPHLFSQVQQREKMVGKVEKIERDENDSRKSSISSTGGTSNVRGPKVNPAFQSSFDTRSNSGSNIRNQFESTINQPLPPNPNRSGIKFKNPPGGRSTGLW